MQSKQSPHSRSAGGSSGRIPVLTVDTSTIPPDERFAAVREFCGPLHDMEPAGPACENAELGAVAARLGRCILTRVSNTASYFARTQRHLRMECCGHLRLCMLLKGRSVGILGEDPFRLSPGEIRVFDFSRPYRAIVTDAEIMAVIMPHAAVGYDPARHPGQFNFTLESAWGRVLEESTRLLFGRLPEACEPEAERLAENYCALVRGIIHIDRLSGTVFSETRHAAMRRFVDRNLDNPDLKASDVCLAFNMSRASVYREFGMFGGIARYITRRRMEEAMRDLARACSSCSSRGLIKRVSARWGFHDPSHFNRLFRTEFGFSPSEFADLCATGTAPPCGRNAGSVPRERHVPDISLWLKSCGAECPPD